MPRVRSQDRLQGFDLEPERTFHRRLREARDTNNLQALVQLPVNMEDEQHMAVQEVAMPSIANVTSSIVKPRITGDFLERALIGDEKKGVDEMVEEIEKVLNMFCKWKQFVEVFMDDFSVFGSSYDDCLKNLGKVLACCEETTLVLNRKKCHLMVQQGIILGHRISKNDIEVDKAKVEGVTFKFDEACLKALEELKEKLVAAPIIKAPDWSLPFELMCNASDHAIGAVLGQRKDKMFYSIYYASKTLDDAQLNYTTTEKELLEVVWAFEKFRAYLEEVLHDVKFYYWDESFLYRQCANQLMRRYILKNEVKLVLYDCHASPYGGHHGGDRTTAKVLQSRFYWPTLFKDAHAFVKKYDQCQRPRTTTRRHDMPLNNILEVEIFYVWDIDFMGPLPLSKGSKYILLAMDYVLKWVEAIAFPTNDAKVVATFVKKNIFSRFWTPRALISDEGTHFCKRKDWDAKLDDSLWAYRTAYKIPIGASPYNIVYGKAGHLPVKLEHKAYWTVKKLNMYLEVAGKKRLLRLNELDEFKLHSYENSKLYKEKTKRWHNRCIMSHHFEPGQKVAMARDSAS
ncbi:uncharacterized protein LOC142171735 [Nicotiana tabacum]|uniref:Uncharacterized protein LOC142171735 n=1 Tax=Nicotiana tabacum TaxID=4097 RepID=A0AC58T2R5_TOBAC